MSRPRVRYNRPPARPARRQVRYGFLMFLIDLLLLCITGGFWAFWIAFKFLRTGHR